MSDPATIATVLIASTGAIVGSLVPLLRQFLKGLKESYLVKNSKVNLREAERIANLLTTQKSNLDTKEAAKINEAIYRQIESILLEHRGSQPRWIDLYSGERIKKHKKKKRKKTKSRSRK
jgi:hypothetical protein